MKGSSERWAPQTLSAHPPHPVTEARACVSSISACPGPATQAGTQQMLKNVCCTKGVDMEERRENSAFWIDAQISSAVGQLSTHPHTCTPPQSPQWRPTHHECHCLTGWLGGVLSLLIKSQTSSLLPTHSSLSRSFLKTENQQDS